MKNTLRRMLLGSLLITTVVGASEVPIRDPYTVDFQKMNQYFDSLIQTHFNSAKLNNIVYPRTDIKETAKSIILNFDLAGVDKKDIKLSIDENNVLTIKGQKQTLQEDKSDSYVKREIFYGSFKKMVQLPDTIEQDKLQTHFSNGILTITIPKKEMKKAKARIIPIQ